MRRMIGITMALAFVAAACGGDAATTTTAAPTTTTTAAAPTTTAPDAEPVPEPESPAIPTWGHAQVILDMSDLGIHPEPDDYHSGVFDIKVAQRPDGSFVAIVLSHRTPAGAGDALPPLVHVIESVDLTGWTEIARFPHSETLTNGPYVDHLVVMPDGTLRSFAVTDRPGDPIHSASSADGGVTWAPDPGPVLTAADFGVDVRFATLSITALPDGRWRMYVNANECDRPSAMGGDNCPAGENMASFEMGVQSVLSAVSDDLVRWTVEPGFRFRGSTEISLSNFAAWVDDDGRTRLIGTLMWTPNSIWREYGRFGSTLGELISDDGLTFDPADHVEYWVGVHDVQVVRAADESVRLIGGSQGGAPPADHKTQIRMLEPATITFWVDPAVPRLVAWQGPEEHRPDQPALNCLAIHVHGTGTLSVDVRASVWPWSPASAPEIMYSLDRTVIEAPGTVYLTRVPSPVAPYEGQWEWFPTFVVVTDEHGNARMVTPGDYPVGDELVPAVVDGGGDVASMPCPPE